MIAIHMIMETHFGREKVTFLIGKDRFLETQHGFGFSHPGNSIGQTRKGFSFIRQRKSVPGRMVAQKWVFALDFGQSAGKLF